ncbi:MFS transporter [Camelliibacillus cellulosilyticus]|uniref:MFS transporter n=1 Tax=Camelliibacillus cellulosilyticus TaxID=2174486 RepID=A0ABV9GM23_9BACL
MTSIRPLLHIRYVRVIVLSTLFSQMGTWVRNLAVLLFVMEKTHGNAVAVSMISVSEYAPIFLFSIIGGTFADRWQPKRTVVICDLLSALSVGAVLATLLFGSWQTVFLASFISAVLSQFATPSGMKLAKIHLNDNQFGRTFAILQFIVSAFTIVGPMMGTVVYQSLNINGAIAITCICFLLSAMMLIFLPPDNSEHRPSGHAPFIKEMAAGFNYIFKKKILFYLSLSFLMIGLGVGLIQPLGIFLVTDMLKLPVDFYQWTMVPYGAGEILGGLLVMAVARKLPSIYLLAIGIIVSAASIALTGMSMLLWLTMAGIFLTALVQPFFLVGNMSLIAKHTDEAFIGRVNGIRTPLFTGATVLMTSLSGFLKTHVSLTVLYFASAIMFLLALGVLFPMMRPPILEKTHQEKRA